MKRVVITGMGIWSCLGKDLKEVCDALRAGRSGIGVDQARLDYGYRSGLTGIVERPVLKKLLDRRSRVGLSEEAEYAYMPRARRLKMRVSPLRCWKRRRWASSSATTLRHGRWWKRHASWTRSTTRRCWGRADFPVDELYRDDEPQHDFPPTRHQFHGERGLCKRFARPSDWAMP